MQINLRLDSSWLEVLGDELGKDYFGDIKKIIAQEISWWEVIYPPIDNIFNAFSSTSFDEVKVVILGQDPYHWVWLSHGLCFSVPDWIRKPPSLQNIFKELKSDLWIDIPVSWNLTSWANQWVLLLNAILTVRAQNPASHSKIWWEKFTDSVIKKISDSKNNIVFILWWSFAQSKEYLIDPEKHLILKAAHPSPFSAYRWFYWCKHFSKTNSYLLEKWINPINWEL